MSANNDTNSTESEKPAAIKDEVHFPDFPEPEDKDFDDDIPVEEKNYYIEKFTDLSSVNSLRLHCTACDRHLGSAANKDSRMRSHPMLRTLMCHTCHSFYNSGEFDKGDDGSELYCRWCGQGGQVYCCSDCPVVFCARCIKRNLGVPKIKEIENADDWKCFKCNPNCLWDLRATCWALLRYCNLKNRVTQETEDVSLKEAYENMCATDYSECCRNKIRKKVKKEETKKLNTSILSKIPPTIQVKKFASILPDDAKEKKQPLKRAASPKHKILKTPVPISPATQKIVMPVPVPPLTKKMRMISPPINPLRFHNDRMIAPHMGFTRVRSKLPIILNNPYNGFKNAIFTNTGMYNNVVNDNINLSLESLTQGLDVNAMTMANNSMCNDDVVCTPDFPMEPLCEVNDEPNDDDVQCMTPGPVVGPMTETPPPLVPRVAKKMSDLSSDNIIQMTENDVTVNSVTGGLKFRVDPQTLSSNKMYRLPDGRIFAINANPNMPGGYSATIVAVSDNPNTSTPKGNTYAAKLSAVPNIDNSSQTLNSKNKRPFRQYANRHKPDHKQTPKAAEEKEKVPPVSNRECDLKIPVEWFRYNLVDAIDSLEYSLNKLKKLKKEATTMHLRTRTLAEMRHLHKGFDRLLNTSITRFNEVKGTLNSDMKQYAQKKMSEVSNNISDDDDDDVEILNDADDNDDPIYIDEISMDSNTNGNETQVDLTGGVSSEHHDSAEHQAEANKSRDTAEDVDVNNEKEETEVNKNKKENDDSVDKIDCSVISSVENAIKSVENEFKAEENDSNTEEKEIKSEENESKLEENESKYDETNENNTLNINNAEDGSCDDDNEENNRTNADDSEKEKDNNSQKITDTKSNSEEEKDSTDVKENENCVDTTRPIDEKSKDTDFNEDKNQDVEMSEELIETLLKDDENSNGMDVSQDLQEP